LLNFRKHSNQVELDQFFSHLSEQNRSRQHITKSAFFQARKHISHTAFIDLNQRIISDIYNHDASTMSEISAALSIGKEVITHSDSISIPGWTGAGYVIFDPETGEGAYKISGGSNGGWLTLLMMASWSILSVTIFSVGTLVAGPFIVALASLTVFTTALAWFFGFDFKTYENEINFINVSASLGPFGMLARTAVLLGAKTMAIKIAATAIGMEILFGIHFLSENK